MDSTRINIYKRNTENKKSRINSEKDAIFQMENTFRKQKQISAKFSSIEKYTNKDKMIAQMYGRLAKTILKT